MGLIKFRPITPTQRYATSPDFSEITADRPYKPLTEAKRRVSGRNNHGRITSRHRAGGHKKRFRIVDFKRKNFDVPAKVLTVEYDPNRSARIALVEYATGVKSYILCPDGLKVGEQVVSGMNVEVKVGNHLPLAKIPDGTMIHNIELQPGCGGKLVRSAGGVAQVLAKENDFANIKLPSGEVRKIPTASFATIGQCSNPDNENVLLGKAGRSRWLGIRPCSRGVVRNPVDHPLGGGEGKSKGGNHPQSPWGQKSKGLKTRRGYKPSNKYIVKDRRK